MKLISFNLFLILVLIIKSSSSTTIDYNEYCPFGYSQIAGTQICIWITSKPSSYVSECLKTGSTSTVYYYLELIRNQNQNINKFLVEQNYTKVWLPIKIYEHYFYAWDLPGPLKQTGRLRNINFVNTSMSYNNSDDCIVYDAEVEKILVTDCSSFYHHMCLFNASESIVVRSDMCDSGYIGRLAIFHDLCFKISDIDKGIPVHIQSNDTFAVINQLIDRLNMKNEVFFVYDSFSTAPKLSVLHQGSIQSIDKQIVTKQIVSEYKNINKNVSIYTWFNTTSNHLIVIIVNYELLWNPNYPDLPFWCNYQFDILNDYGLNLQYELIYSSKHSKAFRTYLSSDTKGIATIWCEGQMLKTFKTIRSRRLKLEFNMNKQNYIIRGKLKSTCLQSPCNVFAELEHQHMVNEIKNRLEFEMEHIQIKRIESLDAVDITMLLHFVLKEYNNDFDDQLFALQAKLGVNISDIWLNNICNSMDKYFPAANLNEKVLPNFLCYNSLGLIPTQKCVGNLIDGVRWLRKPNTKDMNECSSVTAENNDISKLFNVTLLLQKVRNINIQFQEVNELISSAMQIINSILLKANRSDLLLVSQTLYALGKLPKTNIFNRKYGLDSTNIFEIIDKIFAQQEMKTDVLEKLVEKFAVSDAFELNAMMNSNGVSIFHLKNLILVFVNPLVNHITGIELHRIRTRNKKGDFRDYIITPIRIDHPIENSKLETLELKAHISLEAFSQIRIIRDNKLVPPDRIIFKIFNKLDSLFNEADTDDELQYISVNKMISIKIPDYPMRIYPDGIVTMFKPSENITTNTNSWFELDSSENYFVVCNVVQPQNVGLSKFVGVSRKCRLQPVLLNWVNIVLKYITLIGCNLSMIGLIIIFITTIFNPAWKRSEATPLVLHISTASMLLLLLYYVEELIVTVENEIYCRILGVVVHYAVLVNFFISIIVTNCQYNRYLVIAEKVVLQNLKLKLFIYGWLAPLIIVGFCFGFARESYSINYISNVNEWNMICFPADLSLYLGLHLPIFFIFCYNLSIYIRIIKRVREKITTTTNLNKPKSQVMTIDQIRLFLFLFFCLSITWIFALFHYYSEITIFAMLFNITGSLQGFCLFIFCVVVHQKTRRFWIRKLKCKR